MDAAEVQKMIDASLASHIYQHHKNRCATTFHPPTREEVSAYAKEKGLPLNVDKFMDFYGSKGWKVGKVSMKDWRLAVNNAVRDGWGALLTVPKTREVVFKCYNCGRQRPESQMVRHAVFVSERVCKSGCQ